MQLHAIQTGTVVVKESQRRGSRGNGPVRLVNTLLDSDWTEPLPIYAWVIEHPEGVIVVDTGDTAHTADRGYLPWWHPYYQLGVKLFVQREEEIGPQLRRLGILPQDVRWLIMTHLHTDHAGGLHHFPQSEILVSRREYELAAGWMGRLRGFLPNRWPSWFTPQLVDFVPTSIESFRQSFALTQSGDVHLVPTPGHTAGHLSVIVQDDPYTYFLAGDTSYTEQLMLDQVVDGVTLNNQAARRTLAQTRRYVQSRPTIYLPSHDPDAAQRLADRQTVPTARTETMRTETSTQETMEIPHEPPLRDLRERPSRHQLVDLVR